MSWPHRNHKDKDKESQDIKKREAQLWTQRIQIKFSVLEKIKAKYRTDLNRKVTVPLYSPRSILSKLLFCQCVFAVIEALARHSFGNLWNTPHPLLVKGIICGFGLPAYFRTFMTPSLVTHFPLFNYLVFTDIAACICFMADDVVTEAVVCVWLCSV